MYIVLSISFNKFMKKKYQTIFFTLLLSVVSFFWLTAHVSDALPFNLKFHQTDPDSIFFTRLLEQSVLQGKIIELDSYACFPYEIKHSLAPFYLQFLVYTTWLIYSVIPLPNVDPIMIAGALPIVFLWFSILAFFVIAASFSKDNRLIPFLFFASLPGLNSLYLGRLFYLDYDFLITFLIWSYLLLSAVFVRTGSPIVKVFGALVTTIFIGTWLGSPLFFFLVTIYGIYAWLSGEDFHARFTDFSSVAMIIGALVNLLIQMRSPELLSLSLVGYTLFQPMCVLTGGIFLRLITAQKCDATSALKAVLVFFVSAMALSFFLSEPLKQAKGILFKKDPLHSTINELRPILKIDQLAVKTDATLELFGLFSWPVIFLPFFLFLMPASWLGIELRLLSHWLAVIMAMAFYQIRYIRWLGAGEALLGGLALFLLWKVFHQMIRSENGRKWKLIAALLPLIIVYSLQQYSFVIYSQGIPEHNVELFNWISKNTPETSGYSDDKKPEYGILTFWDEGNLLSYYCRRPVVVGNYILGYKTKADIFSSETEDEAYKLCSKYGVKYILITSRKNPDITYSLWQYLKKQPEGPYYQMIYHDIPAAEGFDKWFYNYLSDGMGLKKVGRFDVASRFRVVYASKADNEFAPANLFYEVVKGAEINVKADPGSKVQLSLEFLVSDKPVVYRREAFTDSAGECRLIVPYSTSSRGGRIETAEFYKLMYISDGQAVKCKVFVNEEQIQKGTTLSDNNFVLVE